jgi:L-threonylcarbamoyladenylate synthase
VVVLGAAPGPAPEGIDWVIAPDDPAAYAHRLYALLRELDAAGYDRIVLQRPPMEPAWQGVNDRIGRAAAAFER